MINFRCEITSPGWTFRRKSPTGYLCPISFPLPFQRSIFTWARSRWFRVSFLLLPRVKGRELIYRRLIFIALSRQKHESNGRGRREKTAPDLKTLYIPQRILVTTYWWISDPKDNTEHVCACICACLSSSLVSSSPAAFFLVFFLALSPLKEHASLLFAFVELAKTGNPILRPSTSKTLLLHADLTAPQLENLIRFSRQKMIRRVRTFFRFLLLRYRRRGGARGSRWRK